MYALGFGGEEGGANARAASGTGQHGPFMCLLTTHVQPRMRP